MIKHLRKVGNSNALILDRPLLELLGLEENGAVQLMVRDGALVVTPVEPRPVPRERLDDCLDKVVRRRRSVLRRLAE